MITNETVNRAIDYIMKHIKEEINIDDVAEYCHFSKFYFSRMFKAETGESIYAFIKRAKLKQSAFKLKVQKRKTITDIGLEYGYTPSNYSAAFKQYYKTSPALFRKTIYQKSVHHPFYHSERPVLETYEECCKKITIETIDDIFAIYERRIGNYHNLGLKWGDFMEKYKEYITPETLLIERTYDDPSITDVDKCLYDICLSVDKSCPLENTCIIPGGRFAVYHFEGSAKNIYAAYQSFFNVWFSQSRYAIDERYGFDIYRDVNCDSMNMVMEFYFPIK